MRKAATAVVVLAIMVLTGFYVESHIAPIGRLISDHYLVVSFAAVVPLLGPLFE